MPKACPMDGTSKRETMKNKFICGKKKSQQSKQIYLEQFKELLMDGLQLIQKIAKNNNIKFSKNLI
mgnify:CR=1 FL=1